MNRAQTIITGFDPEGPFAGMLLPPSFIKRQHETRFKQEWKLTLAQYLELMQEFVGPRHQRGSIQMGSAGALAAAGTGVKVVLTNRTILNQVVDPTDARAIVSFRNNGVLREIRGVSQVNTDISGQYIDQSPITNEGNNWAVRALVAGANGSWSSAAAVDDTWITISADRQWRRDQTVVGTATTARTFEIGPQPTGPADDSATITCVADVII